MERRGGALSAYFVGAGNAACACGLISLAIGSICLGSGAAVAEAAPRTTIFVDRSTRICSDAGPGTAARPYCLISEAAAVVKPGGTVRVAAGVYADVVTVRTSGTSRSPITLTAAPGATVVLQARPGAGGKPRAVGFHIWQRRWITVNGFTVSHTSGYGIDVENSSNITLTGNHVSYAGRPVRGQARSGIYLSHVTDSRVLGNTTDHNTSYGINVGGGSHGVVVRGNVSFANAQGYERAASGIRIYESVGNTLVANVAFGNEDSGIEFDHADETIAANNVAFDNRDHGIDAYHSRSVRITGNTVYDNLAPGIDVEGESTGATISRNVSVDNALDGLRNRGNIRVETGSTDGTTMDHDDVYVSRPNVLLIWDSVSYMTLSDLQTATGQELHGRESPPEWVICTLDGTHTVAEQRIRLAATSACNFIRNARR